MISRRDMLSLGFLRRRLVEEPAPAPEAKAKPKPQPTPLPALRVARIVGDRCLAYQGQGCSVCLEHCPVKGAMGAFGGRPFADVRVCTGCGDCINVCPAPVNAIVLIDRFRQNERRP